MKLLIHFVAIIILSSWVTGFAFAGDPCGNNSKNGSTGCTCKTGNCPKTGDPFDPYTGNEYREIRDLEVWGGVGEIALVWKRYGYSRFGEFVYNFGVAHNWNSSFNYNMADAAPNGQGQSQVTIHYAEGGSNIFTQDKNNPNLWLPIHAVDKRLFQSGNNFILQMANGQRYRFEKLSDRKTGGWYYQLQDIRDSHQNLYKLSYDDDKHLTRVTEPAGRYLQITYDSVANGSSRQAPVITEVATSDGRKVRYHYGVIDDPLNGFGWVSLMSVDYGDGTRAVYTYSQSEPGSRPNLSHAIDPRYEGANVNMKFTYNNDNVWGFIREEINGVTGKVMVTLQASGENRVVCYANGRTQHFTMPGELLGMVKNYTDGLGRKTTYGHENETGLGDPGFITSETDPLGRVTTYNLRTVYGNPLEITYADGAKESWSRNDLDQVLTHTDELGRVTRYTRDGRDRITRIDYPDGSNEKFTYNQYNQELTHMLRNGGVERNVYDTRALLISFGNALGYETNYVYDNNDRPALVTDARGNATAYEYNEKGLLTTLTNPDLSSRNFKYDDFGNQVNNIDEMGHNWIAQYDEFKRPVSKTDPLNRVTKFFYDLPGGVCGCAHDNGQPTRITLPGGKTTVIEYDVEWQKIKETAGAGSPDQATTFYEYDLKGNLVLMIDPRVKNWLTEYDKRNRKKSTTDPLGNKTEYFYDAYGNLLTLKRPDGGTVLNRYDGMNRIIQTTNPKGEITTLRYDDNGNLVQLTDAKNNEYLFSYDMLDRRITMMYPNGKTESFKYDEVNNLVRFTTRSGQVRNYLYDNRNREILSTWSDNTPSISHSYDAGGKPLSLINSASILRYSYDDANELTSETQAITGTQDAKRVLYQYNEDGLPDNLIYPGGSLVHYSYTGRNQIASVSTGALSTLVKYTYDVNGNRIGRDMQNGAIADYAYNDDNRLISLNLHKAGISFARFDYGYDNVNRKTFVKREGTLGDIYKYDGIDQLTAVQYDATIPPVTIPQVSPGNGLRTVNYDYDAVGNRISLTDNGATSNYTTNNLNQYSSINNIPLTYNLNGDIKTHNGWSYEYDAQDRLINAEKGNTQVRFGYDAQNRCVKRTVNGIPTFFYYSGWNIIEERLEGDILLNKYVHGLQMDEILSKTSPYETIYYHYDGINSVVKLSDAGGNVIEQYNYDAFGDAHIKDANGNAIAASAYGNRFMFTGREFIAQLDLYDYRSRFYSAALGRFLQPDPIGFYANDINLYRYVRNTPVNLTDPLGLITCTPKLIDGAFTITPAFHFDTWRTYLNYFASVSMDNTSYELYIYGNAGGFPFNILGVTDDLKAPGTVKCECIDNEKCRITITPTATSKTNDILTLAISANINYRSDDEADVTFAAGAANGSGGSAAIGVGPYAAGISFPNSSLSHSGNITTAKWRCKKE